MGAPILWIEAARGVLMLWVVGVHVNIHTQWNVLEWWPFGIFSCFMYGLAVPGFFFLSGFVTGAAHSRPDVPIDRRSFLRRKLALLAVPFVLWNVLLTLVDVALGERPGAAVVAFHVLTGYWQLYFVCALLQVLAIFLWLHPRLTDARLKALLVAAFVLSAGYNALSSALLWTGVRTDSLMERELNRVFVPWLFYFFLGVYFARRPSALAAIARTWPWWCAAAAASFAPLYVEFAAEEARFWHSPLKQFAIGAFPYQVIGTVAFVACAVRLERTPVGARVARVFATLAPDSLGVYLCHTALLMPLFALWKALGFSDDAAIVVPALWAATAVFAWTLVRVGRRLGPAGRVLFAARGPRPAG